MPRQAQKRQSNVAAVWVLRPVVDSMTGPYINGVQVVQTNIEPPRWAIKTGGQVLSKSTGQFAHEPMPSSRTDNYFNDTRFTSMAAGVKFAKTLIPKWKQREDGYKNLASKTSRFGDPQ